MTTLGHLIKVDLRNIWQSEAQDFTPWLAGEDNLVLLGDTLGIDLELEAVEQNVGPFRADILCKDTLSDRWVLIENQLERTDHTHLGQLMTYAAGLDAVTIVWIAAKVTDEHRAAMDWLNEITASDVRFFALEIELWRIGDSPAAPKFNVVSKPNDWSRGAASGKKEIIDRGITAIGEMQREYWAGVQALIASQNGPLKPVNATARSWVKYGIGKSNIGLKMTINTKGDWVRTEIYLKEERAKSDFSQLYSQREELEAAFGDALDWQELPEKQACRICVTLEGANPQDKADWPRQHKWLVDHAVRLHEVFKPYIARLTRAQTDGSTP